VFFCTIYLYYITSKRAAFCHAFSVFHLFILYCFPSAKFASLPPAEMIAIDTNTLFFCLGYGFVDFENPVAAETAVKALQAKGVQAQMAKVGISLVHRRQSVRLHDKLVGEYNHTK